MLLSAGCAFQPARAGILEDLLAVPVITGNCAELIKAETEFNSLCEQRRRLLQQQNRESPGSTALF